MSQPPSSQSGGLPTYYQRLQYMQALQPVLAQRAALDAVTTGAEALAWAENFIRSIVRDSFVFVVPG